MVQSRDTQGIETLVEKIHTQKVALILEVNLKNYAVHDMLEVSISKYIVIHYSWLTFIPL